MKHLKKVFAYKALLKDNKIFQTSKKCLKRCFQHATQKHLDWQCMYLPLGLEEGTAETSSDTLYIAKEHFLPTQISQLGFHWI